MLNMVTLVGKVYEVDEYYNKIQIEIGKEGDNGGIDTIYICISDNIMSSVKDAGLKKGDIIGVRGHIRSCGWQECEIVADRITYLSSTR